MLVEVLTESGSMHRSILMTMMNERLEGPWDRERTGHVVKEGCSYMCNGSRQDSNLVLQLPYAMHV